MRFIHSIGVLLGMIGLAASTGCSELAVTKISAANEKDVVGQRFSLPKPYIQVTPQADGSISADIVYLPDPDHTYAVDATSRFSDYTLSVTTVGGIIQSAKWTGDSTAVVAQGIQSAANTASTVIQADQKKATDAAAKVADATKAVADASLNLQLAQSDLALVIADHGAQSDILKAELAVNDASIKLQAAQGALGKLLGNSTASKATADKPVANSVYGPILYAINEEIRSNDIPVVSLKAVTQNFVNGRSGAPATSPTLPPESGPQPQYEVAATQPTVLPPELYPQGNTVITPDEHGNMALEIVSTGILRSLPQNDKFIFGQVAADGSITPLPTPPTALISATIVHVNLKDLKAGKYVLHLPIKYKNDGLPQEDDTKEFTFEIAK